MKYLRMIMTYYFGNDVNNLSDLAYFGNFGFGRLFLNLDKLFSGFFFCELKSLEMARSNGNC